MVERDMTAFYGGPTGHQTVAALSARPKNTEQQYVDSEGQPKVNPNEVLFVGYN